jgi:hypothetical protein
MFNGKLRLEAYVPDEWVVLALFAFIAMLPNPKIVVPRGFITDLASIPRLLRWLFDVNGVSRQAAVLHDYLYSTQPLSRADADALFLEALKSLGASKWECFGLYYGVRIGGWWAWHKHQSDTFSDNFVSESYWADEAA